MKLLKPFDERNETMKVIFTAAPKTEIRIENESDANVDAALVKVEAINGELPRDAGTDFPNFTIYDDAGNELMGG